MTTSGSTSALMNLTADDFMLLANPYRRELLAHCYRMLGSVHDAEDLVLETYRRAWRAYARFDGHSSLRTWLHAIATTACLSALDDRDHRSMPTALGGPADDPTADLVARPELPWLEPLPDTLAGLDETDPTVVVAPRESVQLELVAALQQLPARQRAVLILRDVLHWPVADVADALDMTAAAVNSAAQRARGQLDRVAPRPDVTVEPARDDQDALLARWADMFRDGDFDRVAGLVTDDVVCELPPFAQWVVGPDAVRRLINAQFPARRPGDLLLRRTRANGTPAFATYLRDEATGGYRAYHVQVLTLAPAGVRHLAIFFDTSLFAAFGLPTTAGRPDDLSSLPGDGSY
ncbi:MAG TPA: RNA polymerase subunit sigma-70 [Pseudonocardiaceae bacterium]